MDERKPLRDVRREAREIRRDIDTAVNLVKDALRRYKQRQIAARNRKEAANEAKLYAELDIYDSREEIQENYGWGWISESEYNRLLTLWDAREKARKNNGVYTDRVIEMLDRAINSIGNEYLDLLDEADEQEKAERKKRQRSQEW